MSQRDWPITVGKVRGRVFLTEELNMLNLFTAFLIVLAGAYFGVLDFLFATA